MILKAHENPEYQDFLHSDRREAIVGREVYEKLIKDLPPDANILDFGCGTGYASVTLARLGKDQRLHVFACDYQEDLLDSLWRRIAREGLDRITPFHMPDMSSVLLPGWLPVFDVVMFSFSLSAVEDAFRVLATVRPLLRPEQGKLWILDWERESSNQWLKETFPEENRLTSMILNQWAELTGYKIRESRSFGDFFLIQASAEIG